MRSVAKISQPYRSKLFGKVAKNIPHNKRRLREPIGTENPIPDQLIARADEMIE
jgi:hypothetical protein